MEPSTQPSSPAIPIAIISGFAMIAIAIFFTSGGDSAPNNATSSANETESAEESSTPRAVTEADYIRGNPNAPILMIEYSDYDCPFCQQYHNTMNQIMDEYGVTGRVAWVYRQFPLAQLHPNAPRISEAALCVGDIAGEDAFWQFSDLIFEERDASEPTNVTRLPQYAESVGVDRDEYISCMNDQRMRPRLEQEMRDGFNAGARGTPYTVLIVGDQQAVINGAQPYETVKGIVENLLEQLDGTFDTETTEPSEVPTTETGVPILN